MGELKLTGNCLRGSRPLLSFDPSFTQKPHYQLLKELLTQIFGVPKQHPKSQPFFDHVYTFTVLDNRIWFRNFQILSEDGALAEVGPRFVLNPVRNNSTDFYRVITVYLQVKIFSGSFGGVPLWENPHYVSPAKYRQEFRLRAKNKYENKLMQKKHAEETEPTESYQLDPLDDLFKSDPLEIAKEIENNEDNSQNSTKKLKGPSFKPKTLKKVKKTKKLKK